MSLSPVAVIRLYWLVEFHLQGRIIVNIRHTNSVVSTSKTRVAIKDKSGKQDG